MQIFAKVGQFSMQIHNQVDFGTSGEIIVTIPALNRYFLMYRSECRSNFLHPFRK